MSTETEAVLEQEEQMDGPEAIEGSDFALFFELENTAVNGRRAAYELLKSMAEEKGLELTPALFSRYCTASRPEFYIETLVDALGAKKLSTDKLLDDVSSGLAMFYGSGEAVLNEGLKRLIAAVREQGVAVGALSALPEDAAHTLMDRLGLSDAGVELIVFEDIDATFPRADTWMKIAKRMDKPPRRCMVLASSATASKAALSAGMRCVAVPCEFTSFQDFGGAEMVIDSFHDCDLDELVKLVYPLG